jgi:hypothetical protein
MAQRVLPQLTDTQCGFKFFPGDVARAVARQLRIDGFAFDVEMLRATARLGVEITEVPVIWSDKEGSTLRTPDGAKAVSDLFQMWTGRWA